MRRAVLVLMVLAAVEAASFAAARVPAQRGVARQATLNDIVAQIDREEARALAAVNSSQLDRSHRIEQLGKLIIEGST